LEEPGVHFEGQKKITRNLNQVRHYPS